MSARLSPLFTTAITVARTSSTNGQLPSNCSYNARALAVVLEKASVSADTIRGVIYDDPSKGPKPTTPADIGDDYDGHWWVEAQFDNETWTLDLCSELPERHHQPLVMQGVPTEYVSLERNPQDMDWFDPDPDTIPNLPTG